MLFIYSLVYCYLIPLFHHLPYLLFKGAINHFIFPMIEAELVQKKQE